MLSARAIITLGCLIYIYYNHVLSAKHNRIDSYQNYVEIIIYERLDYRNFAPRVYTMGL